MNVTTRGVKNALRSPLRSGAIVLMFAISIGLIFSMLVARSSILAKIDEVKATAGTAITVQPAGVMGLAGGGDPLTSEQIAIIKNTTHVESTTSTLTEQLGTDETNLVSSLELGAFGMRQMRFDSSGSSSSDIVMEDQDRPAPTPRVSVTGTTDVNSVSTDGGDLSITSGSTIDAAGSDLVALVGSSLAEKNDLQVGDTFTAYGSTITVKGIFKTDNVFQDSGVIMPLSTVQTLTNQAGAVTTVIATVDSSDNVSGAVTSLKNALGDKADITSEIEQATSSVESLQGIANLALGGVIGSAIAGAAIILLAMIMIVRERRREIGTMKAIGGTNGRVVGQFMIEGLALTVMGAFVGLVLGVFVSSPLTSSLVTSSTENPSSSQTAGPPSAGPGGGGVLRTSFAQVGNNIGTVSASLTPQIFATAIGVTLLISLIGSALPAWFIARIRPAEVLRTE